LKERVGESRLVVESDLDYRSAGRSLHEHEYLRIRSEVARVFPPGHLQSPVMPLALHEALVFWVSHHHANRSGGLRDGEDVAGDELWRDLWWSVALIGVVLIAVSGIGWLAF
jgi:hypothetical protein